MAIGFVGFVAIATERQLSMSAPLERRLPEENRLLAVLPHEERERLLSMMHTVQFGCRQLVNFRGESNGAVYFPISSVVAVVSVLKDGTSTDVGIVGKEGMVGLPAFLGAQSEPFELAVQNAGAAHRMPAARLADEVYRSV